MNLPLTILKDLPASAADKWYQQFVETGRVRHEGVWRRTQEVATSAFSGYHSPEDARWKLVHFFDEYDLEPDGHGWQLVLKKPYIWVNTALPGREMDAYFQKTLVALEAGGWDVTQSDESVHAKKGKVFAEIRWMPKADAERQAERTLPEDYRVLDVEIFGPSQHLTSEERGRPWNILRNGIRKALQPGLPRIVEAEQEFDMSPYLPFHLELGCGPSIEAGVPPLSHLHKAYAISNPKTHDFIIGSSDDLLERFFSNPEAFYANASLIYATALKAQPNTLFYQEIKRLYDAGHILPPIFTNNYDGLTADLGLPERYLRKFDDSHLFPDVEFDPRARALVVVGSHADRRKLQEKARVSGLQVIYVDPEQYEDDTNNDRYHYGIEAPQDDDLLLHMSAQTFAEKFLSRL